MIIILVLIFGLFFGSFLNVLVDRFTKGESVIGGRSYCEHCKKNLAWHDLIPVLSFFFLKGKCRYCRIPLSYYYPVVEMTTGALFVLTVIFLPYESIKYQVLSIKYFIFLAYYLTIVSSIIVVFFADLKYGIIPDKIIFPSIVISFLYLLLYTYYLILPHLLSGIGAFSFFLLLFLITRGKGMGFGDVKFSFLMGLILGFPSIVIALYIAFLTGALCGCILIVWKRKKLLGTKIPFGPFLVLGTIVVLFFGERLTQEISYFFRVLP